jgi:hypothetical protein
VIVKKTTRFWGYSFFMGAAEISNRIAALLIDLQRLSLLTFSCVFLIEIDHFFFEQAILKQEIIHDRASRR